MEMDITNLTEIEKNILDFSDELDTDIKIKPNFYIHMALLMAQKTLMISVLRSGVQEGIIAYSIFVEHIEMLCKAANYLGPDYEFKLSEYLQSMEYKSVERKDVQTAKLSNKKIELLMTEIFGKSPIYASIKG